MSQRKYQLLTDVHLNLKPPAEEGRTILTREHYEYFHYCCDQSKDAGFGCGYRTIQTICSMIKNKLKHEAEIPSIKNIQEILVRIGDKSQEIINSRNWIGTVEGSFIFDEIFNISSHLIHIPSGENISSKKEIIVNYFEKQGGLIFMGGDSDASAKMIAGVHVSEKLQLLIVDPHYQGIPKDANELVQQGFVRWQDDFLENSFYNLCLPKIQ